MQEFEQATRKDIQDQIRRYRVPLIIIGLLILLILGLIVLLLLYSPNQLQGLVTASIFVTGSILGFFGTAMGRVSSFFSPSPLSATAAPERAGSVSAFAGLAGAALVDAFQNGYKQILIEFDYLNHNVSVTYPLVEYFILHSDQLAKSNRTNNVQPASPVKTYTIQQRLFSFRRQSKANSNQSVIGEVTINAENLIKDAYDFLTQIVWTNEERADEIGRIARAAFGPIGAFIGAQMQPSSPKNGTSSTPN
jgi:hypothetical protein